MDCSYSEMDRSIFQPARPVVKEEHRSEEPSGWQNKNSDRASPSVPPELFPNRPHLLWDFLDVPDGTLDWTAPLQAIQELMKQTQSPVSRHYSSPPPPDPSDSLDRVLSPDQIVHLRAM